LGDQAVTPQEDVVIPIDIANINQAIITPPALGNLRVATLRF